MYILCIQVMPYKSLVDEAIQLCQNAHKVEKVCILLLSLLLLNIYS